MQAAVDELNKLEETEDAAKDAYDEAVESGGPDLAVEGVDVFKVVEAVAAVKLESEEEDEDEKPTKVEIKKMKPASARAWRVSTFSVLG